MKYWIGAALIVIAAFGAALSGVNEYFFYAAYIVLTFVVLSTAWNILGGYAGYVNFGTGAFFGLGSYSAVVLFKALEAPLFVQILAGAAIGAALGFGVGIMTLRLMGANPVRIKQWAFGIATGVSALAGAMLIIVGPVEPALDRLYIGRTFCVVVLAGLGSMTGTLAAGLILGISESIVLMMLGASWAPAVAFGLLLIVLGIRPQGLFGR